MDDESLLGVAVAASPMRSAASGKGFSLLLVLKRSESNTALPCPELDESLGGVPRDPPSSPPMWCCPCPLPLPLGAWSGISDRMSLMSGPMLSELGSRIPRLRG